MQPWMTSAVTGLLDGMEKTGDWSARPILADALQDAGYDASEILARLRDPAETILVGPQLRRILDGATTFQAVSVATATLTRIARNLAEAQIDSRYYDDEEDGQNLEAEIDSHWMNLSWLLDVLRKKVETGEDTHYGFDHPDSVNNEVTLRDMWQAYEVLTGQPPPKDRYFGDSTYPVHPFRCAC